MYLTRCFTSDAAMLQPRLTLSVLQQSPVGVIAYYCMIRAVGDRSGLGGRVTAWFEIETVEANGGSGN